MGRPKRLYPCSKRDGRLVSVQFSLNGEADSVLFGQTPKLGKLGDQTRSHIILDIKWHCDLLQNTWISKKGYSNI